MSSSSDIPSEIVVDILSHLPVKSLLRFRCVSTSWLRLIDSSDFVKSHLNQSVENNTNLSLILTDRHQLVAVDLDSLVKNDNSNIVVPFVHPQLIDNPRVCASCNGLVCLSGGIDNSHLFLWNPFTKKFRELPHRPSKLEHPLMYRAYGFGYDSVNDDYKVIRIIKSEDDDDDGYVEVDVYSLKSNSWHSVEKPAPHSGINLSLLRLNNGKLAGGAIHWVDFAQNEPLRIHRVVGFDLVTEEYRLVPQPEYSDVVDYPLSVESFNGRLSVICFDFVSDKIGIWVMKDYGVKESWTKLYSLADPGLVDAVSFCPLAYSHDCCEILVHDYFNAKLLWYSISGKRMVKTVGIAGIHDLRYVETCFGSLVPISLGPDA